MILPAFLLAANVLSAGSQQQMVVSQPTRLAMTPILDGRLEAEEWDPLTSSEGFASYFQWEPGKLHLAATLPEGKDLVVSLDMGGDGWLLGKDNLEVRALRKNGNLEVTERLLDATRPDGPAWVDAGAYRGGTSVAADGADGQWTIEMTLQDPGTGLLGVKAGSQLRMRVDATDPGNLLPEPFLPRETTMLTLALDRASNLPSWLIWKPEFKGRNVTPGSRLDCRMTFSRTAERSLKRADYRTIGLSANSTRSEGIPFPDFDSKNRAFFDYDTDIASDATLGYRVVRAVLTDEGDGQSVVESSFEVAPLVFFEMVRPEWSAKDEPREERVSVYIRSNSLKRIDGVFSVMAPEGWTVQSGNDKPFVIISPRGSKRHVFSITVPGGFRGSAPLKFRVSFPGSHIEQVAWLSVQ